jgi:hypothetical protein
MDTRRTIKEKPPFPGIVTKESVIPRLIEVLKKHGMRWEHLITPKE